MRPPAKYRQACGCVAQGARWLELCPGHAAEDREIRERWQADHDAARVAGLNLERAAVPPKEIA